MKSHRSTHSQRKSPACAGYRLSSYRAHDEYYSLYSLYSSEEYRDMKWSFFRECGGDECGGGDDGDRWDDSTSIFIEYDVLLRSDLHMERSDGDGIRYGRRRLVEHQSDRLRHERHRRMVGDEYTNLGSLQCGSDHSLHGTDHGERYADRMTRSLSRRYVPMGKE